MYRLIRLVSPKVFLLCFSFCVFGVSSSKVPNHQIYIAKAGDGWDLLIDSALTLIKNTDSVKYSFILHVCDTVDIWTGKFSSNDGIKSIIVSVNDIKLNSINNLAAILVHESMHLYYSQNNIQLPVNVEERNCYVYEFDFLRKLYSVELWLLQHTTKQIQNYTR
jgi:hypothetical protein